MRQVYLLLSLLTWFVIIKIEIKKGENLRP